MSDRPIELRPTRSTTDGDGDAVNSTRGKYRLELSVPEMRDDEHDSLDAASTNAAHESLVVSRFDPLGIDVGADPRAEDDDVHDASRGGGKGAVGSPRPSARP
jgi:hypothetical protein